MRTEREITADIVIAGAGHAGGAVARALRELGFPGSILLVGAERHLPHERPALSKEALRDSAYQLSPIVTADEWRSLGVITILGDAALGADAPARRVRLSSGRTIAYATLILATGASPRRMAGPDHPGRQVLRTFDDALAIRRRAGPRTRLVIVGGGPIGLEAAASLRPAVAEVTVVEAAPRLMARCVPADLAGQIADLHEANGVRILVSSPVSWLRANDAGLAVGLSCGKSLEADLVIEGIGIVPETHLAEALGLATSDGLSVDVSYRTADPAIFAIGDCACPPGGRQETWSHAESSARAAARAIVGLAPEPAPLPYFWTDQHGARLQVAGNLTETNATVTHGAARLYEKDGLIAAAAALNAPRDFAAARRMIGKPVPAQPSNQRPPIASVTLRQPS